MHSHHNCFIIIIIIFLEVKFGRTSTAKDSRQPFVASGNIQRSSQKKSNWTVILFIYLYIHLFKFLYSFIGLIFCIIISHIGHYAEE